MRYGYLKKADLKKQDAIEAAKKLYHEATGEEAANKSN